MSDLRRSIPDPPDDEEGGELVRRPDGSTVDLGVLDELLAEFARRRAAGEWARDRATSDRWLAPRLHYALRLTRAEAADRRIWTWLADRHSDIVGWRWRDEAGQVAEDRRVGPIHKQVLARLWWGAELFRNGDDYEPVERLFLLQDLPNSYLHRPVVRCRSLALALVDLLVPRTGEPPQGSAMVNAVARVLNLATAGCPPELETGLQQDDRVGFLDWASKPAPLPSSWDPLPAGPPTDDTTPESLSGGNAIAARSIDVVRRLAEAGR